MNNGLVSPFGTLEQYKKVQKKLAFALLLWVLIALLGGGLLALYFFEWDFVVINNLKVFSILKLSNFSIELVAISSSFYLVVSSLLISHFWLLFATIKNSLWNTILVKKSTYVFNFFVVLTFALNWFLIFYYLLALRKYFWNAQRQKGISKKRFFSSNANQKIQSQAQESLAKLEQKKLFEDVADKEVNLEALNIRKAQDWSGDSTQNLESKFPEIIKTDDLNKVLHRISSKEKELQTIKDSQEVGSHSKLEQENEVKSSLDLNRKILKTAIYLKELQEKESSTSKKSLAKANPKTKLQHFQDENKMFKEGASLQLHDNLKNNDETSKTGAPIVSFAKSPSTTRSGCCEPGGATFKAHVKLETDKDQGHPDPNQCSINLGPSPNVKKTQSLTNAQKSSQPNISKSYEQQYQDLCSRFCTILETSSSEPQASKQKGQSLPSKEEGDQSAKQCLNPKCKKHQR